MGKKWIFVQQSPYDNVKDSFTTIAGETFVCFPGWLLSGRERDRFEAANLEKKVLSVEVLVHSGAAVGSS